MKAFSLPVVAGLAAAMALAGCGSEAVAKGADAEYEQNRAERQSWIRCSGHEWQADDASTTNDESNDQELGCFGSITLNVTNQNSGNSYPLDAETQGYVVEQVYFRRGGNVDFPDCELEDDYTGECVDEGGNWWTFNGPQ